MAASRACVLFVIASLLGGGLTAVAEQPSAAQMMDALMYGRGSVGGPFTLSDQTGKQRSDTEFRGKLMIVYSGYTYCPDVCPTDLMAITQALNALGPAAEGIQPVFITIDPERDTKVLADYVSAFHHSLIGLTALRRTFERSPIPKRRFTRKCLTNAAPTIRSTTRVSST
jgi:cytochrome oxidase Cu insertion factor (SCO1/SenC/PrrC family)